MDKDITYTIRLGLTSLQINKFEAWKYVILYNIFKGVYQPGNKWRQQLILVYNS